MKIDNVLICQEEDLGLCLLLCNSYAVFLRDFPRDLLVPHFYHERGHIIPKSSVKMPNWISIDLARF